VPITLPYLSISETFRLSLIFDPLRYTCEALFVSQRRAIDFMPEADYFGGVSPPSPKGRTEREQMEKAFP